MAKLTAGGDSGIDVAFVSGQFAQALDEQGLLEPIDHALVPNIANLYPEAAQLAYDPGNVWSVPYSWGTTGLCYREDLTAYTPDSWYDLLTPKEGVSGKTTMLATERWLMLPAQKALGFSVNTTDAAEMDGGQAAAQRGQADPARLRRHDLLQPARAAARRRSWRPGTAGATTASRPDVGRTSSSWCPRRAATCGPTRWSSSRRRRTRRRRTPSSTSSCARRIHSWVVENILYKVPNKAAMELIDPALVESFPNLGMTPADLLTQERPRRPR